MLDGKKNVQLGDEIVKTFQTEGPITCPLSSLLSYVSRPSLAFFSLSREMRRHNCAHCLVPYINIWPNPKGIYLWKSVSQKGFDYAFAEQKKNHASISVNHDCK